MSNRLSFLPRGSHRTDQIWESRGTEMGLSEAVVGYAVSLKAKGNKNAIADLSSSHDDVLGGDRRSRLQSDCIMGSRPFCKVSI